MGRKHYQTVDSPPTPQVGRGLLGVHLLILHLKFQFSKSIKSLNILYFPQFNLSFEQKIPLSQNAQKSPKNLHKIPKQWLM